ncbi:MAG: hypothetical protein BZ151_10880 [Desulfobacca sp. 4484_104]|nr:MAG: hypothetical protein BZ151_10880 [Desulfobacca sp. 4484_104]RLA88037.1 MAG: hypothetical protein DRG58_09165 [Deltaproteobacteria bacterium]
MSNTITKSGHVVSVVFDGSSALDLATELGVENTGLRLRKINFYPVSTGETLIIREKSAEGPILLKVKDDFGFNQEIDFPGVRCFPYVKGDEITANTMISFIFE